MTASIAGEVPSVLTGLVRNWEAAMADRLEIGVITYNRAEKVRSVLEQLAESPFRRCVIHVLDNCSGDHTSQVCKGFLERLPRMNYVRHRVNIGACANYLRAIELCTGEYSWILCDDDRYDFSLAGDICEQIALGRADLISVGVETHSLRPGWLGNAHDCAMTQDYFLSHSFTPSLIFRGVLFDSPNFIKAYDNSETLFPQIAFVCNVAQLRKTIYISREKVIRKSNTIGYPPLRFISGWLRCCGTLPDATLRRRALGAVFRFRRLAEMLCFGILIARQSGQKGIVGQYVRLMIDASGLAPLVFLKLLGLFPAVLLLMVGHPIVWKLYLKYREMRHQMGAPNYDGNR